MSRLHVKIIYILCLINISNDEFTHVAKLEGIRAEENTKDANVIQQGTSKTN
jgi:hypothetical protein